MKLKSKIFNWLFKEQIEDIQGIKNECDKLLKRCIEENQNSKHSLKIAEELELRLKGTVGGIGVAADINVSGFSPNWAVVCIQGKTDFVKFINLGEEDIRNISRFLNNFDRRHINIDIPPHFRNTDFFLEIGKH